MGAAMRAMFGPQGDTIIRVVMIISMMSSINAYHLMATRIPFAMAKDGMLFGWVTRVNRGGTPSVALWLSVLASVLFIAGGKFFERLARPSWPSSSSLITAWLTWQCLSCAGASRDWRVRTVHGDIRGPPASRSSARLRF